MSRPRKNSVIQKTEKYSPSAVPAPQQQIQQPNPNSWNNPKIMELGTMDSEDYFYSLQDTFLVSMSRDFKRRFNIFGESTYKELVCALKTILWIQLMSDFPQTNLNINIILPNIDFGVAITTSSELKHLIDQRFLQERLDQACQSLAAAVHL